MSCSDRKTAMCLAELDTGRVEEVVGGVRSFLVRPSSIAISSCRKAERHALSQIKSRKLPLDATRDEKSDFLVLGARLIIHKRTCDPRTEIFRSRNNGVDRELAVRSGAHLMQLEKLSRLTNTGSKPPSTLIVSNLKRQKIVRRKRLPKFFMTHERDE